MPHHDSPSSQVSIRAPARLHLGFLDLNGEIGRKFGSFGLAISEFETSITGRLASTTTVQHGDPELCQRAENIIATFYQTLGKDIPRPQRGVNLDILATIPSHAGLGSGTQLTLVIGTLLCRLHNLPASTAEIALHLGRGMRSGIGIATFDQGGFVLDGGLKLNTAVPPILCQHTFPDEWRIILIRDPVHQGMHGSQEKSAFNNLPSFPTADAQAICHLTLMQLLPAIVESDLAAFGNALNCIQCYVGDHFTPAQGGRFSSQHVAETLAYAVSLGHDAIAQSSWGPTGCIFARNAEVADQLVAALNQFTLLRPSLENLHINTTQANHQGAVITEIAV